jgi:hypothetical protein
MEPEQDDRIVVRAKALKIFDLRAEVTNYLPGELDDWPPNIQDQIYAAMERVIRKARLKGLDVIQSFCGRKEIDQHYHVVVTCCETKGEIEIIRGR